MSNENINKILESLDGLPRAEASAFFYTRLKAKMLAQQAGNEPTRSTSWLLKPAFVFAAFTLLLFINIFVITINSKNEDNNTGGNDNTQAIAADYSMPDANSIYDLALEK